MTTPWLETTLTPAELRQLEQWVQAHGTPQQVVVRSRIALAAAAGRSDLSIAAALDVNRHTVRLWRQRIGQAGVGTVWEIASGRGRKARYGARKRDQIIRATLHDRPRGQTHWSCRTLAAAHGVSKNTINRLWQLHNLKPHLQRTFKLSRDPQFLEKLTDVVGLYLNPPQHAVVICVDEKSQIQALDRTQPGLPLKKRALRNVHARLQAQWHHDTVCRVVHAGRQGDWPVSDTPSAAGVAEVPAPIRPGVFARPNPACDHG